MQYTYGEHHILSFGQLDLSLEMFDGIKTSDLCGKVVVASFNLLFIGDLAFLAMLLGMVGSA